MKLPLTLEVLIGVAALVVTALGSIVTYKAFVDARNAELVKIGIDVLKIKPGQEGNISAAREWALNLIDANSGVKFSKAAREELLQKPLPILLIPPPVVPPQ